MSAVYISLANNRNHSIGFEGTGLSLYVDNVRFQFLGHLFDAFQDINVFILRTIEVKLVGYLYTYEILQISISYYDVHNTDADFKINLKIFIPGVLVRNQRRSVAKKRVM